MTTFSSDKQHIHLLSDDKGNDTPASNIVHMVEKTGNQNDHVTLKEVVKDKVDTAIEQKNDYDRNKDVMQFVDNTNNFLRNKSTNVDNNHQLIATLQELVMASQSENFHLCLGLFNIGRDIFEHIDRTRLQLKFGKGSEATNDYNNVDKTHNDILRDIIKNNQSKEGLRHLLNLWNMLNHSFYEKLDNAMNDPSIAKILNDVKRIANSHVGDRSIDLFLLRVRAIISLVENDKELGDFVKEVQSYLKDVIDKPDILRGDDYRITGLKLYGKAVEFARKYQNDPDLRSVIYDGQIFADYHFKTPQQEDIITKIAHVPINDEEFLPMLKKEIIPFLASKLKEIPVKGFKISNPDFEHLLVDDIYVSVDDILPDHIGIKSENTAVVKMNDSQDPLKAHSVLSVQIYGLRLIVKDFYFSFKRKTPIIDFSDEGRGSINLKGEGLTIFIKYDLNVDAKRTVPVLQTGTVDVKLDNFDLDFTEANHKIILNVASSLFKPAVEKEITNAVKLNIEQYVTELANLLNNQLATLTTKSLY